MVNSVPSFIGAKSRTFIVTQSAHNQGGRRSCVSKPTAIGHNALARRSTRCTAPFGC
jgi:hypothetical protein